MYTLGKNRVYFVTIYLLDKIKILKYNLSCVYLTAKKEVVNVERSPKKEE
jgi:hypothetical protein